MWTKISIANFILPRLLDLQVFLVVLVRIERVFLLWYRWNLRWIFHVLRHFPLQLLVGQFGLQCVVCQLHDVTRLRKRGVHKLLL